MKHLISRAVAPFARFVRDTQASATVEAVMILPLLLAWFVGSFVFFDGFKNRNMALKATYTIGDILSRRTEGVTEEYITNLQQLYDRLAYTTGSSAMRVTSLTWSGSKHRVLWSQSSKPSLSEQTNAKVKAHSFKNRIPLMAVGETVILVETFTDYNPAFNVGWDHRVFENFVVTSPRFASCLSWDNGTDVPSC
ncbi:TadE/TadG family type IV pilus assembly protein [Litoreibacter halocynthiae]|uniref:TadE/TadG family type IV pilus assembly protein n=1 Tax=Litoreibacter halocynthiae TaxID=1242689 RepID=UPI0024937A7F|nr:pilus assembly protein [Litoreibacter halocynthiae]